MRLKTLNDKLMPVVNWLIVLSMAFLVLCISLQIFNRFAIKIPMLWTEEYSKYAFVWLTMFGSAKAVREKSHIFVDVMEVLVKGKVALVCGTLAMLISMVFFITLVYVSVPWALKGMNAHSESIQGVRLGFFYMCMPVSGVLMTLFGLEVLIDRFKGTSTAEEGEEAQWQANQ